MRRVILGGLLMTMALLGWSPVAQAIDVAIPSDMHTYDWTGLPAQVQPGTIMTTQWQLYEDIQRGYAVGYNESGEIEFFKQGPLRVGLSYWRPDNYMGRHIHGVGHIAHPEGGMQILEADMTPVLNIPIDHPDHPDWYITAFEAIQDDNGDIWTVWFDPETVDMSQIVPGGNPNATVLGNVIEKWDEDGNVLWTWNSHDHMTGGGNDMDYFMLDNQDQLLSDEFETMHVNGMHLTPDGDLLISARFMSLLILVDYPSGDILWRMGGGSGNQWTFTGDPGPPLSFNRQHDGKIWPDGNLTVFDNGNAHDSPRSYAREYSLDTENLEAELVWWYAKDQVFDSNITGSVRKLDNGNRLICWGALDPPVHVTELNADNEVVWEMHTDDDPVFDIPPRHVRAEKTVLQPSALPYVCPVYDPVIDQIEIVCNWFGHENEVSSYAVYIGVDENNLQLMGTTNTGFYYFNDAVMVQEYFCQIQPLDGNGDPAGPMSDVIRMQFEEDGLALTAMNTMIPAGGGTLMYAAHVTNGTPDPMLGLVYQTEVVLPNGNTYGPLMQIPFSLFPYMTIEASSLTLQVPGFAPEGDYTFTANVLDGNSILYTDSFLFNKAGAAIASADTRSIRKSDFISGGDVSAFSEIPMVADADDAMPSRYELKSAYPNPFNPTTTVNVALPEAAELTVAVYNVVGQQVATLTEGRITAGNHSFVFDASGLASGLYFVRATVPGELNATQKVMLVR